jgi:hypothetical protein
MGELQTEQAAIAAAEKRIEESEARVNGLREERKALLADGGSEKRIKAIRADLVEAQALIEEGRDEIEARQGRLAKLEADAKSADRATLERHLSEAEAAEGASLERLAESVQQIVPAVRAAENAAQITSSLRARLGLNPGIGSRVENCLLATLVSVGAVDSRALTVNARVLRDLAPGATEEKSRRREEEDVHRKRTDQDYAHNPERIAREVAVRRARVLTLNAEYRRLGTRVSLERAQQAEAEIADLLALVEDPAVRQQIATGEAA